MGAYVDVRGLRTYYEARGAGPPVVMLHGGCCPVETFAAQAEALEQRYRVYLPERRANGRTPDVEGPLTYQAMTDDTAAFMGGWRSRTPTSSGSATAPSSVSTWPSSTPTSCG